MSLDTIRVFTISKLAWIKQQQQKFRDQDRETPREYLDWESHHVWGKRYLLTLSEHDEAPLVQLKSRKMLMRVRPGTNEVKRDEIPPGLVSRPATDSRSAPDCEMGGSPRGADYALFHSAHENEMGKLHPQGAKHTG